jgi:hypothetical protein
MTEIDDVQLDHLAPTIDMTKARALFDDRRRHARARRRALLASALVGCLVVSGLGVWAVTRTDGGESVDTGPAASLPNSYEASAFEVVTMHSASEPMGTLRAATDAASLLALWQGIGFDGEPPPVDLDTFIVVSMTIPDDACPPTLTYFEKGVDAASGLSEWTPKFTEPASACIQPLNPKTYVVTMNRAAVAPGFVLHLPPAESPMYYTGEPRLTVHLDPLPYNPMFGPPGEVPPRCVDRDAAFICLQVAEGSGQIGLVVSGLRSDANVAVSVEDGRSNNYLQPECCSGRSVIVAAFAPPAPGSILRMRVASVVADGEAIEGLIGIAG